MSRTRHPTTVVFDLDGLMFNTEDLYHEVGAELLRRRGREATRELMSAMMGRPGDDALQLLVEEHALDESVEDLARESDVIFAGLLDGRLAPMPGLFELLAALETAGIPKAIATSSGRQIALELLRRFDFVTRFEFLLTAQDVPRGKPHPDIYQAAARKLAVDIGQMLVLEDSENGCRAAVTAGAYTVAVPTEHSIDHDFSGAQFIANGLRDERIFAALGLPPAS